MRKIQIGVMGSAADLKYSAKLEGLANEIGCEVAKAGAVLVFGAEKDYDSLSTAAGRGARQAGGLTLGVTYGKDLRTYDQADITVATGLERGGGREFSLVLSCDVIITICGGSGTLNEMLVAYQAGIPIIAMKNSGGWSDKMTDQYFDNRKRVKVIGCNSAKEAVKKATTLAKEFFQTRIEHEHL